LSTAKNSKNSHGALIVITLNGPWTSSRLWSAKGLATIARDGRVGGELGDMVVVRRRRRRGHTYVT